MDRKLWNLEVNSFIKPVRSLVDCDYIDSLNEENRVWMNRFLGEFYKGNVYGENTLHNTPELKKSVNDSLNSARRATPLNIVSVELLDEVQSKDNLSVFESLHLTEDLKNPNKRKEFKLTQGMLRVCISVHEAGYIDLDSFETPEEWGMLDEAVDNKLMKLEQNNFIVLSPLGKKLIGKLQAYKRMLFLKPKN